MTAALRTRDIFWPFPYVAGWGRTRVGGLNSPSLREVAIPMVPNDDCRTKYHKDKEFINHIFDNTVMCAGTKEGGRDSCQVTQKFFMSRSTNHINFFTKSGRLWGSTDVVRNAGDSLLVDRHRFVRKRLRFARLPRCLHSRLRIFGLDFT